MNYTWIAPRFSAGDRVWAHPHKGRPQVGRIDFLRTSYSHTGAAFHTYYVRFDGRHRHQFLGEDRIISLEATHDQP